MRTDAPRYSMDGLNRVTQALYPTTPNIVERFSYDGEGNLLTHVDGRGITSQMSYDNPGRVKDNFTIGADGNILRQAGIRNIQIRVRQ